MNKGKTLEDQEKRMDTAEHKIRPVKGKPSHESRLAVIIIRSVGEVRSFKISSRIVLGATIFFLIYIPTSIFVINSFFELHHENIIQSKKIRRLERDLSRNKRVLHKSRQYIACLEDDIRNLTEQQEEESAHLKGKSLQTRNAARGVGKVSSNEDKEDKITRVVNIQVMVIQKDGSTMTIKFNVVNIHPGENAVGGMSTSLAGLKDLIRHKYGSIPSKRCKTVSL